MHRIHWPDGGHQATYRRLTALTALVSVTTGVALGYWLMDIGVASQLVAIFACMGAVCVLAPIGERSARAGARRAELRRSYAGLVINHHGLNLRVEDRPWIGAYPTRRLAAAAAMKRGRWSVLVPAYGRWWAMDAELDETAESPFALRGCAVMDVVPAIA